MFFTDTTSAPKIYVRGANWIEQPAIYIVYSGDPVPQRIHRSRAVVEFEFQGMDYATAVATCITYHDPTPSTSFASSASWRRTSKKGHYAVTVHQETTGAWIVDT